ncbi:MAG: hypothetical protein ACRYFU_23150 [Janthinobacterium lividum]
MQPPRLLLRFLAAFALTLPCLTAFAADPITGTVTNRTTGKPSAGDQVVLIQLQAGMQESTRTTTDARGHFSLSVPDEGIHLVRVTHQKAAYFQPVQPDQHAIAVTVFDAAPEIEGVRNNVEELHVEATATELHVVEVLQVLNESSPQRTQFGPKGYEFYLPPGALVGRTGAITQGGMPVQTPAVPMSDPGHFSFLFPIRPGETQFGIAYTLPYTGKFTFTPKLTSTVKTFAVLLPTSMTLTPGAHTSLARQQAKPGSQTFLAADVAPGTAPEFTVAGTGTLPQPAGGDSTGAGAGAGPNASTANPGSNSDANAPAVSNSELAGGRGLNNPLDETGDRDPWAKYKWWILAGLALLLAGAAGVLLRKPSGTQEAGPGTLGGSVPLPHAPVAAPVHGHNALLTALKEELFALETERLQRRISEPEYKEARSAFELILARTLHRGEDGARISVTDPAQRNEFAASSQPKTEPVLTGREGA